MKSYPTIEKVCDIIYADEILATEHKEALCELFAVAYSDLIVEILPEDIRKAGELAKKISPDLYRMFEGTY